MDNDPNRLHKERQVKPERRRIQLRIKPPKAPKITLRLTRPKRIARYTLMRYTPMRYTPARCTLMRYTPMRCTPVRYTPMRYCWISHAGTHHYATLEPGVTYEVTTGACWSRDAFKSLSYAQSQPMTNTVHSFSYLQIGI